MKKLKISLDKLNLNKETMFDLSKNQMNGIKGGVTGPTDGGCRSIQGPCLSQNTNCYSQCQTGCDPTFPGTTMSNDCSDFCVPTQVCDTYFPCDGLPGVPM